MSSVVDRLTDTSKYGGSHAARFSEDGTGKGGAGRSDVVASDGSTNAGARAAVDSDGAKNKITVKKWDGKKFGCQADMPVVIYVHTFTKVNEKPTKIVLNRTIKKWDQMMKKIPSMDSGRPDTLVNEIGKKAPKDLDELFTESHYLAIGPGITLKDVVSKTLAGEVVKGMPVGYKEKLRKGKLPKVADAECEAKGITLPAADKKRCAKLMEFVDRDASGTIEQAELSEMMVMLGYDVTEEKIDEYVKGFDTDGNGGLDIYEFLLLVQKCKADQGDLPGADESKACSIM